MQCLSYTLRIRSMMNMFRMFGTFEAERHDVKIVYGLVDQPQFFNPLKHQVGQTFHQLSNICFVVYLGSKSSAFSSTRYSLRSFPYVNLIYRMCIFFHKSLFTDKEIIVLQSSHCCVNFTINSKTSNKVHRMKLSRMNCALMKLSLMNCALMKLSLMNCALMKLSLMNCALMKLSLINCALMKLSLIKCDLMKLSLIYCALMKLSLMNCDLIKLFLVSMENLERCDTFSIFFFFLSIKGISKK